MAIKENEEIIKMYPFLRLRNEFTDEFIYPDGENETTWLDDFPYGWLLSFGMGMIEEINQEYLKMNEEARNDFRIIQIKEKYGSLRFYVSFATEKMYEIIDKYERISEKTCIRCGKPAKWISTGWISPYCDECKNELEESKSVLRWKEIEV